MSLEIECLDVVQCLCRLNLPGSCVVENEYLNSEWWYKWRWPNVWPIAGGLKIQLCSLAYELAVTWHWPTFTQRTRVNFRIWFAP